MESNCKEDWSQNINQLDKAQKRGKIMIAMIVNKGELHISPADRGKGVLAMLLSMYQKMIRSHTSKD